MRLQSLAVPAAALALALALSGCSGSSGGSGETKERKGSGAAAPTQATETGPLEVDYEVEAVDFGAPGAVTGPGTALALGQPAWLNQTETYGEEEVSGGVGVAVLQVSELDAGLFDQFSNAEEFAGYTPYAVITQHQWLYDTPEGYDPSTVDLFPLDASGADTEYLTSGFSLNSPGDSCGLLLPEYDEEARVLVSCFVALAKDGAVVTSAEYNGESYQSFIASSDNPYFPSPVVWK